MPVFRNLAHIHLSAALAGRPTRRMKLIERGIVPVPQIHFAEHISGLVAGELQHLGDFIFRRQYHGQEVRVSLLEGKAFSL